MTDWMRDCCVPSARAALICVLASVGCGGEDTGDKSSPSMQGLGDGGGNDLPGGGRVGPDGAVQVREKPETDCARATFATGNYWFCETPTQASLASGLCYAAGATLVVVSDLAENDFLVSEMVADVYWIGYSDAAEEDVWVWADGSGPDFENWDAEQPGLDDFVYINSENGLWSTSTDEARGYICEDWK